MPRPNTALARPGTAPATASIVSLESAAHRLAAAEEIEDRCGRHRVAPATVAFATHAAMRRPRSSLVAGRAAMLEQTAAARALDGLERDLATLVKRWSALQRADRS